MSLFSMFSKKKPRLNLLEDRVWMNRKYGNEGIFENIQELHKRNIKPVLICFFKESYESLKVICEKETGIGQNVYILSPMELNNYGILNFIRTGTFEKEFGIVFAEHHPLVSIEQKVTDILTENQDKIESVVFHNTFDDALLKVFGSDRIKNLVGTLGLREDECITHSMITKSIKNAQDKLQNKIINEIKADSHEDWIRLNGLQ